MTIQFLVVVLVEVFMAYTRTEFLAFYAADPRAAAATAEQNVDIPVLRGAPRDFHQNPLPAAGSSDLLETADQGFFCTFPRRKKSAKIPCTQGSELGADFSSWPS